MARFRVRHNRKPGHLPSATDVARASTNFCGHSKSVHQSLISIPVEKLILSRFDIIEKEKKIKF